MRFSVSVVMAVDGAVDLSATFVLRADDSR
jgi:hypothetical protein